VKEPKVAPGETPKGPQDIAQAKNLEERILAACRPHARVKGKRSKNAPIAGRVAQVVRARKGRVSSSAPSAAASCWRLARSKNDSGYPRK